MVTNKLTFWNSKGGHNGLNQTQHKKGGAAHVSQEEHDADAAAKLGTQRSADHVWVTLRSTTLVWLEAQAKRPLA